MATSHAHPAAQSAYYGDSYLEQPPSPTLTNPDMILPFMGISSSPPLAPLSPPLPSSLRFSPQSTNSQSPSQMSVDPAEVGVATAVAMPMRITSGVPTTVTSFRFYEPGPLSDIHEEETTPRSRTQNGRIYNVIRNRSPTQALSPTEHGRELRQKKRLSNRSSGSDVEDWEEFDTTKMMSSRLAADVANASDDVVLEGMDSKRNSGSKVNAEAEMALLDERAERILENARKRLTHMEDNLSKARHSILAPSRSSSNLRDQHKPVGGLYRSISLAGSSSRKQRPLHSTSRREAHTRNASDTPPNLKRPPAFNDNRSVSALEYSRRNDMEGQSPNSQTRGFGYSPGSNRSFNSPLRTFPEDASPSTNLTSPSVGAPRGLGINTFAAISKEDISVLPSSSPLAHRRSSSQNSTRSTQELRDQMSDLRLRIEDLKQRAQADRPYRPNSREVVTPDATTGRRSPNAERQENPVNANVSSIRQFLLERPDSRDRLPITPHSQRFTEVTTPGGAGPHTDARTDRNTPNLHKRTIDTSVVPFRNPEMMMAESLYEDANQQFEDDSNQIAASEEEQIYLNEVLQESLQEIESDVSEIQDQYLDVDMGAERHEDRLDAFDYENMILHSALGTYSGRAGTAPMSDSDSDASSVATKRALQKTPTEDEDGSGEEDLTEVVRTDHNFNIVDGLQNAEDSPEEDPTDESTLSPPSKPWMKHLARTNSMDSTSTDDTFATAAEGDDQEEDDTPNEILHWGSGTGFPYPPTTSPPKREFNQAWPTPPMGVRGHVRAVSRQQTLPTIYDNGMPTPPSQSPNQSQPTTKRMDEGGPLIDRPANTEVLMESLIKLVDPDFKVGDGLSFAEVDKELVLHLLRAVGGACNGVFSAQERGEVRSTKIFRRRLDTARRVLEGEGEM